MPKPSHDDTTQPEPNPFTADQVLGRQLFDLADERMALAAAVHAGDAAGIERATRALVEVWRRTCEARASLDRQLATLILRGRTVGFAMQTNARMVADTVRSALASPGAAHLRDALAAIVHQAESYLAERPAQPPGVEETHDAI